MLNRCFMRLFLVLILVGLGSQSLAAEESSKTRTLIDKVVAVVEGDVITLRALEALAAAPLAEIDRYQDAKEREARRKAILLQALDSVLSEKMIEMEIDANPDLLAINEQDIERAIGEVTRMNQIDRDQLRKAVEAQGIGWSDYRDQLRTQLQKSRLIQFRVQSRVQVTEDDVRRTCVADKFREGQGQVCASHLLLALQESRSQSETIELAQQKVVLVIARLGGKMARVSHHLSKLIQMTVLQQTVHGGFAWSGVLVVLVAERWLKSLSKPLLRRALAQLSDPVVSKLWCSLDLGEVFRRSDELWPNLF